MTLYLNSGLKFQWDIDEIRTTGADYASFSFNPSDLYLEMGEPNF
jgi:hypothetical protein